MQNDKTAILTISKAGVSYLKMSKIPQNAAKKVKMAVFDLLKWAKIDFQLSVK